MTEPHREARRERGSPSRESRPGCWSASPRGCRGPCCLDHLTDAYSTLAIGLGLGWSPYLLLSVGLAVVIAYFLLSINVYLETHVFGSFRFSYGRFGPTEARLLLAALNTTAFAVGPWPFRVIGIGATVFDLCGLCGACAMTGLLLRRVIRNLRGLAEAEPPNVRKGAGDGRTLTGVEEEGARE